MLGEEQGDEGGRVLPPTRRPDGTLRKEVRIRAGYIPQDEVQRYVAKGTHNENDAEPDQRGRYTSWWESQPRGAGPRVPPGANISEALKVAQAKSKSAKKNEKRKVKKATEPSGDEAETGSGADGNGALPCLEKGMDALQVSPEQKAKAPEPQTSAGAGEAGDGKADVEKKLRALRKKLRQGESLSAAIASGGGQVTAEESDKLSKLKDWQKEAEELEARLALSS